MIDIVKVTGRKSSGKNTFKLFNSIFDFFAYSPSLFARRRIKTYSHKGIHGSKAFCTFLLTTGDKNKKEKKEKKKKVFFHKEKKYKVTSSGFFR